MNFRLIAHLCFIVILFIVLNVFGAVLLNYNYNKAACLA